MTPFEKRQLLREKINATTLPLGLGGRQNCERLDGRLYQFLGERIENLPSHARVKRGVVQSPEGRYVLGPLSVEDNSSLGGYVRRDKEIKTDRQRAYSMFPVAAAQSDKIP